MASKTSALIILFAYVLSAWAQEEWSPCNQYCFPRDAQSSSDLSAAGYCPPLQNIVTFSQTYYTSTCSCYDYQITDGSYFSNCYTCVAAAGATYESTCLPDQTAPQAPASCSSKSDDISTACSLNGGISQAASFLCDVDEGLSGKAKGIFAGLKLLEPPLARGALTIVDAACKIWNDGGGSASDLLSSGCDVWNNIGGCPAEDAATGSSGSASSSGSSSSSAALPAFGIQPYAMLFSGLVVIFMALM